MAPADLLSDFRARDLIADITDPDEFAAHLAAAPRTMYVGFDPTADSLHIGSLLPLLALRRVQLAGHRPVVLVGGGTGLIGDPSGKSGERALNPTDIVRAWADRLKAQVGRFVDFDGGAAILADNYDWLGSLDLISFLRDIGKHFPLGAMLAKESVKARLGRAESAGLSFTEFSYQVLQAYDFLSLLRQHDCTAQLGGRDQWGNITAGIELIRRVEGRTAYGLTLPLVTKDDGTKFGKTETGTVWLDPSKTSPYEMYQFWLNTADADVIRFLKYFTFLPLAEIAEQTEATKRAPEKREAQRVLAREVTRLVHGDAQLREAEQITAALFDNDIASLSEEQLRHAFAGAPQTVVDARGGSVALSDLLVQTGLAESKRRSRELIAAGGVTVNGRRMEGTDPSVSPAMALYGRYLVLRKGKKTYHVVTLG